MDGDLLFVLGRPLNQKADRRAQEFRGLPQPGSVLVDLVQQFQLPRSIILIAAQFSVHNDHAIGGLDLVVAGQVGLQARTAQKLDKQTRNAPE